MATALGFLRFLLRIAEALAEVIEALFRLVMAIALFAAAIVGALLVLFISFRFGIVGGLFGIWLGGVMVFGGSIGAASLMRMEPRSVARRPPPRPSIPPPLPPARPRGQYFIVLDKHSAETRPARPLRGPSQRPLDGFLKSVERDWR